MPTGVDPEIGPDAVALGHPDPTRFYCAVAIYEVPKTQLADFSAAFGVYLAANRLDPAWLLVAPVCVQRPER